MENRKYWYFRFKVGFFDDPEIIAMENVPVYGDKFVLTLLKLYDLSTRNRGFIKIEKTIKEQTYVMYLAKVCRTDPNIMAAAIGYFIKHGFLEIDDCLMECSVSVPYVQNNTGRSSEKADRIRKVRNEEIEERKQLSIAENSKLAYGEFANVYLSMEDAAGFSNQYENAQIMINRLSIYKKQF